MPSPTMSGYKKNQRLKSRKAISILFSEGRHKIEFPICFYWYQFSKEYQNSPVLFGVSVPKSKFKKAVDRNLLKRRMKESYRLNIDSILSKSSPDLERRLGIMAVYIANDIKAYESINNKMISGLSFILDSK